MSFPDKFDRAFNFTFKDINSNEKKSSNAKTILKDLFSHLKIDDLSNEEVKRIYHEKVWLAKNIDKIDDYYVARKVFDFCCNIGLKRGCILLEKSLNSGWNKRIKVNGTIGRNELKLINKIDKKGNSDILEKLICHYAANYYEVFGKKDHIKYTLQWIFR